MVPAPMAHAEEQSGRAWTASATTFEGQVVTTGAERILPSDRSRDSLSGGIPVRRSLT